LPGTRRSHLRAWVSRRTTSQSHRSSADASRLAPRCCYCRSRGPSSALPTAWCQGRVPRQAASFSAISVLAVLPAAFVGAAARILPAAVPDATEILYVVEPVGLTTPYTDRLTGNVLDDCVCAAESVTVVPSHSFAVYCPELPVIMHVTCPISRYVPA